MINFEMRRSIRAGILSSIAFALFLLPAIILVPAFAYDRFDPQKVRGPRIDKLCMVIINSPDAQILAAENGDIDILSDITRPSDVDAISKNKNFETSLARASHSFFMLMNNKEFPWDNKEVRKAAAESINRSNIVRTIFSGYCEPINSWLPPVSPWAVDHGAKNTFNRASAEHRLAMLGYKKNVRGILVGPDGKQLEKIKLLTPLAKVAPTTAELAEQVADSLRAVGFPVDIEPMDFSAMVSKIDRGEYSLAVMAWGMGRNPDSLFSFYHSSTDIPGGYNMTGVSDKQLDAVLERLQNAGTKEEAETASAEAQNILADLVPSVPIYSRLSVAAVSKKWKNIITTERMTADNMWTIMLAEPIDGKDRIMKMILAEEPRNLNPFTASSAYSWQVLGMIYEGMLEINPFTLEDMPGLAHSWSISAKDGNTLLTFKLKNNLKWNDGSDLTARDVVASIEFIRKNKIPRFYDAVKNVKSVRATGRYDIEVVMNGKSYWYLDKIGGLPCLPRKVLDGITNWQNWNPLDKNDKFGPYGLIGTGAFMFDEYKPGEYIMMKRNKFYRRLSGETK